MLKSDFKAAITKLERCVFAAVEQKPNIAIEDMSAFLADGRSTFRRMIRSECKKHGADETRPGTSQMVLLCLCASIYIFYAMMFTKYWEASILSSIILFHPMFPQKGDGILIAAINDISEVLERNIKPSHRSQIGAHKNESNLRFWIIHSYFCFWPIRFWFFFWKLYCPKELTFGQSVY